MTQITDVINLLNRGDSPDGKWPDHKGEYWALCPYHNDTHSGNFSVSARGFHCFACGEKGSLAKLGKRLGALPESCEYKSVAKAQPKSGPARQLEGPPVSLGEYAAAKNLPVPFLESLGMKTGTLWDRNMVEIPYYGRDGSLLRTRYRLSMSGPRHERFRWARGAGTYLYGLWKLPPPGSAILVVEGESDTQTLWCHGLNAVGVPGVATWKPHWAEHLEGLVVYIWKEPDAAGDEFVKQLAALHPVVLQSFRWKDLSECHVATGSMPRRVVAALNPSTMSPAVTGQPRTGLPGITIGNIACAALGAPR